MSPTNLHFVDISQQLISDLLMQATNCLKTHLKINVSELHSINEFWYNWRDESIGSQKY
jgi:hypothetical protein